MTKRHCFVTQVGDAIEALASALDPERSKPFGGDILDLLELATKDVLVMRQQFTAELLWKEAVEHELIVSGIWNKSHENDPKKAVKEAIDWYVERIKVDKESLVCGDCDGSGWLDNREEGRYPCTCMTEAEPYQILQEQLAERDAELKRINNAINDPRVDLTITAAEAITELHHKVTLLRDALVRLMRSAPAAVECHNMHHTPKNRHNYDETCPVVVEYGVALTSAQEAFAATAP